MVSPVLVRSDSSTPFEMASRPSGTVMAIVYDALSIGWSLTGNQVSATCGWPEDERAVVGVEEARSRPAGSRARRRSVTTVVNVLPSRDARVAA